MEQVITSIDRAIGYYMTDNKLTREQMSDLLGISTNTLRWKREGKSEWTLSELLKLSEIIGKSPDDLTGFSLTIAD